MNYLKSVAIAASIQCQLKIMYLSQITVNKILPHQHIFHCQANLRVRVAFDKVVIGLQFVNMYLVDFVSCEILFSPVPFNHSLCTHSYRGKVAVKHSLPLGVCPQNTTFIDHGQL